jgi:hypothetical protein
MDLQAILQFLITGLSLFMAVTGALALAVWFSLVIWTFHDIRTRSNDVFTQLMATLMVAVLFVPGALLYMLLRPAETLGALRERSLLEQALKPETAPDFVCPACEREVERRWMVCPFCLYQIKEPCSQCGELMELDWRSCAYCGQLVGEQRHVPSLPRAAAVPALGLADRASAPQLVNSEPRPAI